jgi:Cytochrome c554 and c-prime
MSHPRRRRNLVLTGLSAGLVYLGWTASPSGRVSKLAAADRPAGALAGTASCSGRGCHGGLEPAPGSRVLQNEYSTWVSTDRHANAYHVLFNERSQRIAKLLGVTAAHEEVRCLACHVTPQALAGGSAAAGREERSQGVGCEACHGPAGRWVGPHVLPAFRQLTAAAKQEQYGLTALGDLGVRTQVCAGCHIGAPPADDLPARNMNHDMIAAGHPQLHFEMGSFCANMPKHWRGSEGPDYEARVWAVGQVGSARAALELLHHRASTPGLPWPEFAEYDCFACHHGLLDDATERWRQRRGYGKRAPGSLPWGDWYFSMLPALGKQNAPPDGGLLSGLEELAVALSRPRPDGKKVAELARTYADHVRAWSARLGGSKYDRAALRKLLASFASESIGQPPEWDVVEQLYLALLTWAGPAGGEDLRKPLAQLESRRAFPPQQDSPAGTFRADQFLADLRALLKKLPE